MKLNEDCVRDLLLCLEENLTLNSCGGFNKLYFNKITAIDGLTKYTPEDIFYTICTLKDAGFIDATIIYTMGNKAHTCYVENITYAGHEFLKNISSSKVWKAVKAIALKTGGASLSILCELAESYVHSAQANTFHICRWGADFLQLQGKNSLDFPTAFRLQIPRNTQERDIRIRS